MDGLGRCILGLHCTQLVSPIVKCIHLKLMVSWHTSRGSLNIAKSLN